MQKTVFLTTRLICDLQFVFICQLSKLRMKLEQKIQVCSSLYHNMSLVMRKPAFCIWENKDTDQLRGNCEADQRLCFRYKDSTFFYPSTSYIRNFKLLAIFCGSIAWFVSDLVKNPEDRFSHNEAPIIL